MALITTEVLPADVLQVIGEVVLVEVEKRRVGRKIVTVEKVDPKYQSYKFIRVGELTEVAEIPEGSEFPLEAPSTEAVTIDIVKIGKAFAVTREKQLEKNIVAISDQAREAARVVALEEDRRIFTTLADEAKNTYTATTSWDADTANPYNDVLEAMKKIESEGYNANTLVLNPTEAADLRKVYPDAKATFRRLIEDLGLQILTTPKLPEGTGLLIEAPIEASLIVAEDISVEGPQYDQRMQTSLVNVFERIGVAVKRPGAVVKLAGI